MEALEVVGRMVAGMRTMASAMCQLTAQLAQILQTVAAAAVVVAGESKAFHLVFGLKNIQPD